MNREPLVIRGAVTAAVTAILHVMVVLGVFALDQTAETALAAAIDLIGIAVLVVWTRGKVTPVADPQIPGHVVVPQTPPAVNDAP